MRRMIPSNKIDVKNGKLIFPSLSLSAQGKWDVELNTVELFNLTIDDAKAITDKIKPNDAILIRCEDEDSVQVTFGLGYVNTCSYSGNEFTLNLDCSPIQVKDSDDEKALILFLDIAIAFDSEGVLDSVEVTATDYQGGEHQLSDSPNALQIRNLNR